MVSWILNSYLRVDMSDYSCCRSRRPFDCIVCRNYCCEGSWKRKQEEVMNGQKESNEGKQRVIEEARLDDGLKIGWWTHGWLEINGTYESTGGLRLLPTTACDFWSAKMYRIGALTKSFYEALSSEHQRRPPIVIGSASTVSSPNRYITIILT